MHTGKKRKIYAFLVSIFMIAFFCFSNIFYKITTAKAFDEDLILLYDETRIAADLEALGIDDRYLDALDAVTDASNDDSPRVLSFMEYCYSEDAAEASKYYGLYLYLYNPTKKVITKSGNTVQMATAYDEEGKAKSFENFAIRRLGDSGAFDNRVYKFKVIDAYKHFYSQAKAYAATNANHERRYDVTGIQLSHSGNTMDYAFGKRLFFSGYSTGCNPDDSKDSKSSLECRSQDIETLELQLGHTYYRTDAEDTERGKDKMDQLNSVYFSVPTEDYVEKYGDLTGVHADWYEYKTNPIFVVDNSKNKAGDGAPSCYDALYAYIGKDIGNRVANDEMKWRALWGFCGVNTIMSGICPSLSGTERHAHYSYNGLVGGATNSSSSSLTYLDWADATALTRLDWLFGVDNPVDKKSYSISTADLEKHMQAYTRLYANQARVEDRSESGRYAENLFADSIDEARIEALKPTTKNGVAAKRGYINQQISVGKGSLSDKANQSAWEKFWHGIKYVYDDDAISYDIIKEVTASDIATYTAAEFGKAFLINEKDAQSVYDYCKGEIEKGRTPYLLRFAKTEYTASDAVFDLYGNGKWDSDPDGYVAQETVFLDFDVIDLTFTDRETGKETVIPVVANPIDIISSIEAGSNSQLGKKNGCGDLDWDFIWKMTVFLVTLVVFAPLLPIVFNILAFILALPFKAIGGIFKGIGKLFKKRE